MAYTWTTVTSGSTLIQDEIMDEIHSYLNSLYSELELDPHSWGYNASEDMKEDDTYMSEIKTAIEYADEMNYCRTHYAEHRSLDLSDYNAGKDTTHFTTQ